MRSENEKIISDIVNRKDVEMSFQRNNIERILQRIPQNDTLMKQYMYQWLSCKTDLERAALKNEKYAHLSKEEREDFTLAFHKYILVAERFRELVA